MNSATMVAIPPNNRQVFTAADWPITTELVTRCDRAGVGETTAQVAQALGTIVDAGLLTLDQVLDLVHSCSTGDELAGALLMLAATTSAQLPVGCPQGHEHRVFRVVGEPEGQ